MNAPPEEAPCNAGDRLIIDNRLSELKRLGVWVAEAARRNALPPRTEFALDLVLNEALANIISYGYRDADTHQISVTLEYLPDAVIVLIRDDGIPFNPLESPTPQAPADLESAPIGGLGIGLIKHYSDELSYHPSNGNNKLRLVIGHKP